MRPISFTSSSMSALRQQEGDAGAGRIERIGVRIAPVVLGHVRCDPGDLRRGHGLPTPRRWPAVPWSFTVATTPASSISRTHATAWSMVAAVVAGVDLDARAVGTTAGVERLGGRFERDRLVFQREQRATRRRSSARSPAGRAPRRTDRRPTGRWPRSRSRLRGLVVVGARRWSRHHRRHRRRRRHRTRRRRATARRAPRACALKVFDIAGTPPRRPIAVAI